MSTSRLTTLSCALFLYLAAARPAATTVSTSTTFTLVANVLNYDLTPSIQSYSVVGVHSGACQDYAELVSGSGDTFYANGTTSVAIAPYFLSGEDGNTAGGLIVTPGGTATVPSENVVSIECGAGTTGVTISSASGTPMLEYENGSWMACPGSVFGGSADEILVSAKSAGQRTLEGCADVQLVAQCADGEPGPNAATVNCVAA